MRVSVLETDVAIIGAGVSGAAAALALRRAGADVIVVEQSVLVRNRFCGEFVSGEALSLLSESEVLESILSLRPARVRGFRLFGSSGAAYHLALRPPGLGISRRALDSALAQRASELGAHFLERCAVETIVGSPAAGFHLGLRGHGGAPEREVRSRAVIGAFGKHSVLDRLLGRKLRKNRRRFVGVKQHYRCCARDDSVSLYLFPGGYCGTVGIEDGLTTLCMLATQRALQECQGKPAALIQRALSANPSLADRLQGAIPVEGSLVTVGHMPFESRDQVVNGIFLTGDSAGCVAPCLGIGVANGIRSALAAAGAVGRIVNGHKQPAAVQRDYTNWWNQHHSQARLWGLLASGLLCRPRLGDWAIHCLGRFPALGEGIYRRTRPALSLPVRLETNLTGRIL
jgi:flavin-dependent dehydrogenase